MIGASSFIGLVAKIIMVYGLIYLLFVVLFCYVFYHLLKHCCCACVALRRGNVRQIIPGNEADPSFPTEHQPLVNHPTTTVVTLIDCAEDDGYHDRMINPGRYNTQQDAQL